MKDELDIILEALPRASSVREGLGHGIPAMVYLNDSGDLVIIMRDYGILQLGEKNLPYLKADVSI